VQLWRLPEIKLAPDLIFTIPGINFPVTNTLLCTWISIIILVVLFLIGTRNRDLIPSDTHSFMGWMQNFIEWIVDFLRGLAESVAGKHYGRKFFPLAATFFVFILVSNLLDVIPGVDTIGSINRAGIDKIPNHGEPVLGFLLFGNISNQIVAWIRPATTDLNLTLSMALIAVVTAQVWGFATLGAGEHLNKYLNVRALRKGGFEGYVEVFVGLLEIISELGRILSLAFRLFGNVFAGSVVLAVFAFLLPFVADVIFIPFELLVAVIQAFVFALLTLVYCQLAISSHDEHGESEAEHEQIEEVERRRASEATRQAAATH
jgi:F-type H+-transporting ATPase subunit a